MALKVGELSATLGLDSSGFDRGLKKAKSSMSDLSGTLASIGASLGLAKLGQELFGLAVDFESAFAGVRKTTDATEAQYAELEQSIIDMSKSIPASATEIAGVAEAAGQLGIARESLMAFTRVMVDLGESTDLSATDAATALAQFANITGMSAENYSRLGSAIVGLGNNFATTESAITDMAQRLAGTGSVVGMSEADMLGFAAAISSIGMESQLGGTAMSTFATKMASAVSGGGKQLKKLAKVAGMSTKDFKKLFQEDATGAITAFISGLGSAEDKIAVLESLGFTDSGLQRMLLGLAEGGDLLTSALDTANNEWNKNTALAEEANKRYATMESTIQKVKNNITELGRQFGDALAPYVIKASTLVSGFVTELQKLSPEAKDTIIKIGLLVTALGPGMAMLKSLAPLLSASTGMLKVAIGPLGLIAAGLYAVYKTSPKVQAKIKQLGSFFKKFWKNLENGSGVLDAFKKAFKKTFGKGLYMQWEKTFESLGAKWEDLIGWFKDTGDGLSKAFSDGKETGGVFGGLVESAKYLMPRIGEAFKSGWSAVTGAAKKLGVKALTALGSALQGTSFSGLGKQLIEAALALEEGETIDFGGILTAFKNGVIDWRDKTLLPWVQSIDWAAVWESFWATLTNVWIWIKDKSLALGNLAVSIWLKIKEWGRDTLMPLLSGIQWGDVWAELWSSLTSVGMWIKDKAVSFGMLAVDIWLKAKEWASNTLGPLLSGIDWGTLWGGFWDNLANVAVWLADKTIDLAGLVLDWIESAAESGESADWSGVTAAIVSGLNDAGEKMDDTVFDFGALAGRIVKAIGKALGLEFDANALPSDAKNSFLTWAQPIVEAAYDLGTKLFGSLLSGFLSSFGLDIDPQAFQIAMNPGDMWKLVESYVSAGMVNMSEFFGLGDSDFAKEWADIIERNYGYLTGKYDKFSDENLSGFMPKKPIEVPVTPTIETTGDGRSESKTLEDQTKRSVQGIIDKLPTWISSGQSVPDLLAQSLSALDLSSLGLDFSGMLADGLTAEESQQIIASLRSAISDNLATLTESGKLAGKAITDGTVGGMQEGEAAVETEGGNVGQAGLDGLNDTINSGSPSKETYKIGGWFAEGMANGIKDSTYLITAAAQAAATAAMNKIKSVLGIASPSKVAFGLGGYFSKGFADGIESMNNAVARASRGIAAIATNGLTYSPPRRMAVSAASGGASTVSIDYDRLGAVLQSRPAVFDVDGQRFARATVEPNAAAEARRQARIRAGYGG